MNFKVSPGTPQVESTHLVEGKMILQGVQHTAINKTTNPQMADLQTSKQQIDHQLMDQLLICQWKLMS